MTLFALLITINLSSQCFPDSIQYFEKQSFKNIEQSNLYFDIRKNLNAKNFKQCANLCDTLYSKYPNANFAKSYASICYDKTGNVDKALDILLENYDNGVCVFQRPRQLEFKWSNELSNRQEFKALCPNYNGEYIVPPSELPELRDSLLEILIWTMDTPEKNQFGYLESEQFFKTKPKWNNKEFGKKLESKFERLVDRYGFPNAQKVGERMCLVVAMSIIIHSPNVDFMKKYKNDVLNNFGPSTYALLIDKIRVFQKEKQIYGTQLFYSSTQNEKVFYPIGNPDEINELRIKMGLDTLEKYAKSNGSRIETKYNTEFNH